MPKSKSRLEYNRQILKELTKLVEENPDMRFGQLLINFNLVPDGPAFFTESKGSLDCMRKAIAYYNQPEES